MLECMQHTFMPGRPKTYMHTRIQGMHAYCLSSNTHMCTNICIHTHPREETQKPSVSTKEPGVAAHESRVCVCVCIAVSCVSVCKLCIGRHHVGATPLCLDGSSALFFLLFAVYATCVHTCMSTRPCPSPALRETAPPCPTTTASSLIHRWGIQSDHDRTRQRLM